MADRGTLSSSSVSRHSQRSTLQINTSVVTAPPWARDEPPSPTEPTQPTLTTSHASIPRLSDVASSYSSLNQKSDLGSTWFSFTSTRPRQRPTIDQKLEKPPRMSLKDRSMSWLPTAGRDGAFSRKEKGVAHPSHKNTMSDPDQSNKEAREGMVLSIPTPAAAPFTLSQNRTPGWESPWSAGEHVRNHSAHMFGSATGNHDSDIEDDKNKHMSPWRRRRKRFRHFVVSNVYVPLLFRFINITFTTAALGLAIRIRELEMRNNVLGALGSSPMLVIIFAPPTLVHVLGAIYLEYFGRPLGLWRTSHKLAHTLSEVLFICAWSAALSLCFDNYFTSLVPCAGSSLISWYSQLPRPQSPLPDVGRWEGGVGDRLCDGQLALICLVLVGLVMYCINLVISLFRIFEKVKVHKATPFSHS